MVLHINNAVIQNIHAHCAWYVFAGAALAVLVIIGTVRVAIKQAIGRGLNL